MQYTLYTYIHNENRKEFKTFLKLKIKHKNKNKQRSAMEMNEETLLARDATHKLKINNEKCQRIMDNG